MNKDSSTVKVSFSTFGCRANSFDTDYLSSRVQDLNLLKANDHLSSDYHVVNTCTVTHNADAQVRKLIRRVNRENPNTKIIVTGCMATRDNKVLEELPGVHKIFRNDDKHKTMDWIYNQHYDAPVKPGDRLIYNFDNRCRPFLKIQDGCEAECAFCIIPSTRGRSRSWPVNDVIKQISLLCDQGFKEVVLTGIHIACYGMDLFPKTSLRDLVAKIENETALERLRISSLEPMEMDVDFVKFLSRSKVFCPHLHLSMQSGDDEILSSMKRHYTSYEYREIVETAAALIPDICIGTDIIFGFPGELDEHYKNTLALCEDLPFAYMHCFPYSERPGTPAINFPNKIDPKITKSRMAEFKKLAAFKKESFLNSQVGKTVEVLWEKSFEDFSQGLSRNYLNVKKFENAPDFLPGTLSTHKIDRIENGRPIAI